MQSGFSLLSGVPDLFDRNNILSGGDLSHDQVPHCIRVFFYFVCIAIFIPSPYVEQYYQHKKLTLYINSYVGYGGKWGWVGGWLGV